MWDFSRMGKRITHWMDMLNLCSPVCNSPKAWLPLALQDQFWPFLLILGVSVFSSDQDWMLTLLDTKKNLHTCVSQEQVASWLQRKKEGMSIVSPKLLAERWHAGGQVKEDLPLLLQQAPKSISQGCATVLRALLDPNLKGEFCNFFQNQYQSVLIFAMKAQSGSFLDNCQVRSLPHIDFPAGEEAAKHLWKKTEEILGEEFKRF